VSGEKEDGTVDVDGDAGDTGEDVERGPVDENPEEPPS